MYPKMYVKQKCEREVNGEWIMLQIFEMMFTEIFPKLLQDTKSPVWESPKTPKGTDKKKVHLGLPI